MNTSPAHAQTKGALRASQVESSDTADESQFAFRSFGFGRSVFPCDSTGAFWGRGRPDPSGTELRFVSGRGTVTCAVPHLTLY